MRSVLDDRRTVKDYWFAITLVYVGCDLVSMTQQGRTTEFVIICPQFDYAEYYNEFHGGKLQIADAKAFAETAKLIGSLLRDAKRNGGVYINPDFEELLADKPRCI